MSIDIDSSRIQEAEWIQHQIEQQEQDQHDLKLFCEMKRQQEEEKTKKKISF